jgi:hypothetical protein
VEDKEMMIKLFYLVIQNMPTKWFWLFAGNILFGAINVYIVARGMSPGPGTQGFIGGLNLGIAWSILVLQTEWFLAALDRVVGGHNG